MRVPRGDAFEDAMNLAAWDMNREIAKMPEREVFTRIIANL